MKYTLPEIKTPGLTPEQQARVDRAILVARTWGLKVEPLPSGPDALLSVIEHYLSRHQDWNRQRGSLVQRYTLSIVDRYGPSADLSVAELHKYVKKAKNLQRPLDLGFARWIRETYHLGFQFLVVRESPTSPVVIECPGVWGQSRRHDDLRGPDGHPSYKEALVLVHQA